VVNIKQKPSCLLAETLVVVVEEVVDLEVEVVVALVDHSLPPKDLISPIMNLTWPLEKIGV
jgi:hypothetical protein